jgi:hypothetical protein
MQRPEAHAAARSVSRIYRHDGRVEEYPPQLAYLIWLAAAGTALRVAGDHRPVMPWEYAVQVAR